MVTSQAKPVKIIGQTNFNKVNAPHNVPVTERNGIFTRVLFFHAFCYIVSWNETKHIVIVIQTLELLRSPY